MNINRLRRMAAASGLVAVTLFIGACGSEEAVDNAGIVASPAGTTPSAPAAASPTPSAADNGAASKGAAGKTDSKAESCRKAEKAKADFGKLLLGGKTDAEGIAAFGKGLARLGADLKTIAGTASDSAVAKALQDVAAAAAVAAATKNPLTANQSAFAEAGGRLDAACAA